MDEERYTGFYERGPYPGEEPDITRRQGGWLFLSLAVAVMLTLVSVVLVAPWPLAIAAWVLVAVLWSVQLVAKRIGARFKAERGAPFKDDELSTPVVAEPSRPVRELTPEEEQEELRAPPPSVPDVQSPGTPTL